jgi:hypothetical protein
MTYMGLSGQNSEGVILNKIELPLPVVIFFQQRGLAII